MSTPSTDGKQFANLAYHSAVVSGLAMGYATLDKKIVKGATPKFWMWAWPLPVKTCL